MSVRKSPTAIILALLGIGMVIFAILFPDEMYARVLLGGAESKLSWGPSLFRVLLAFHGLLLAAFSLMRKSLSAGLDRGSVSIDGRVSMTPVVLGILVALSIVALALRLWNLNSDLWIDEVLTLLDFVRKPIGAIVTSFPSQNQHMFFSILARASTGLFGESAWALRLPSVIFGVGSIWAFFFLCRKLMGTTEALLGSALMTFSYHHIWFSQNARGYMGLLFFTLSATWCWLEALEKSKEWRWWVGYVVSVVLGMWVHPTMAFVVAAHGIVYMVFLILPKLSGESSTGRSLERGAGLRPIAAWLLSVTLTLQLYALALPEFLAVGLHEESKDSEWTNPLWVVTETIKSLNTGFAGIFVVVCGGAFVAFGWIWLFRANRRAAVLTVLPALLAGSTMLLLGHNLWPRFFFFSMGFGLLIVIHGAVELPNAAARFFRPLRESKSFTSLAGVGLALLVIVASLVTLPKNYALPKQNFSGAKQFIDSHSNPGDRVVAVSLAGVVYGDYLSPDWPAAETGPELEDIQKDSDRVWLVYTVPVEVKAYRPELWQIIQRDYDVIKVFPGTLNGGEVVVCQRKLFKVG